MMDGTQNRGAICRSLPVPSSIPFSGEPHSHYIPDSMKQKKVKHRSIRVPVVIAKRILVNISLEMLRTHGVINPADAPLDQAPEAINGVGMCKSKPLPYLSFSLGNGSLQFVKGYLPFVYGPP